MNTANTSQVLYLSMVCFVNVTGGGFRQRKQRAQDHKKGETRGMSKQNKDCLIATINNLQAGNVELFAELAKLSDSELEKVLTDILRK